MGESRTAAGGATHAAVGAARLGIDALCGLTGVVESMHATIARAPLPFGPAATERTRGVSRVVYQTIRGVTRLVGSGLDRAVPLLAPVLEQPSGSPQRGRLLAALNGVIGHHLEASDNPLAIRMAFVSGGQALDLSADRLAELPSPGSKLLVLVHGLCMSEVGWSRPGHDHGEALAADLGYRPLYLRYNSGRHISTNGRELARCMEELVERWPAPIDELAIIGHSMGGLVARSACHHARASGQRWLDRLDRLVFVGTPHHGAALERAGNLLDLLLEGSPYAAPLVRIGGNRSAGINDLRFGNLLDEDWQGRPRRYRRDPRTPVPLPERVECHAIAASIGRRGGEPGARLPGDGMVSVASALGRHRDARFDLGLPGSHAFVAHDTTHLGLLSSQEVYRRIRTWLERAQLGGQLVGLEEADPRLAGRGRAPGHRHPGRVLGAIRERLGEREDDLARPRQARDHAKDGVDGVGGQVDGDAQPREEDRMIELHAGCGESLVQPLGLEVDRHEPDIVGNRDAGRGQALALECLCGRLVDLEDAERRRPRRLPEAEGVVAGAQHHELPHAAPRGRGQTVLGEPAPHDHVAAQGSHGGVLEALGMGPQILGQRPGQEIEHDRILEDLGRAVEELMGGAQDGDGLGRVAGDVLGRGAHCSQRWSGRDRA